LSISERGCVEGTVVVPNLLLNGTVKGDVAASGRVELGARARVVGNVRYGLIEMAIGAAVNGKLIHASETAPGVSTGKEAGAVPRVARVNRVGEGT
jgi:cytoskeletal protein CcmA (bactofilin family)